MAKACNTCLAYACDESLICFWEACWDRPAEHVKLDDVYRSLHTGDLLLTTFRTSARPGGPGVLFNAATGGPWVHGGMVCIRSPDENGEATRVEDVLIVEFTKNPNYHFSFEAGAMAITPERASANRGTAFVERLWRQGGILMYPLAHMLAATYGAHAGFLPVTTPSGRKVYQYYPRVKVQRLLEPHRLDRAKLDAFIQECAARPFETNEDEIRRAVFDCCESCIPPTSRLSTLNAAPAIEEMYCVEFVAEAYQRTGLLPPFPEGPPSNEYMASSFTTDASGSTSFVSCLTCLCCCEWAYRQRCATLPRAARGAPLLEVGGLVFQTGHPEWMYPAKPRNHYDFFRLCKSRGIASALGQVCCGTPAPLTAPNKSAKNLARRTWIESLSVSVGASAHHLLPLSNSNTDLFTPRSDASPAVAVTPTVRLSQLNTKPRRGASEKAGRSGGAPPVRWPRQCTPPFHLTTLASSSRSFQRLPDSGATPPTADVMQR